MLLPHPFQRVYFLARTECPPRRRLTKLSMTRGGLADYAPPASVRLNLLGELQKRGLYEELVSIN